MATVTADKVLNLSSIDAAAGEVTPQSNKRVKLDGSDTDDRAGAGSVSPVNGVGVAMNNGGQAVAAIAGSGGVNTNGHTVGVTSGMSEEELLAELERKMREAADATRQVEAIRERLGRKASVWKESGVS